MSIQRTGARTFLVVSLVVVGLAATGQPADASFHLMMIREVFAGSAAQPNAHFVELQMWASGQNFGRRETGEDLRCRRKRGRNVHVLRLGLQRS